MASEHELREREVAAQEKIAEALQGILGELRKHSVDWKQLTHSLNRLANK